MDYITEKLNQAEINHLTNVLALYKRRFYKIFYIALLFEFFSLFTPLTILAPLRGASRSDFNSEFIFTEFGTFNVLFFIVLPTVLVLLYLYFVTFNIPGLQKDIKYGEKLSGVYDILEIRNIPSSSSESFEGIYDYKIVFKINDLDLKDIPFSSKQNPECMSAKAYRVDVARFSKTHLKREIIT